MAKDKINKIEKQEYSGIEQNIYYIEFASEASSGTGGSLYYYLDDDGKVFNVKKLDKAAGQITEEEELTDPDKADQIREEIQKRDKSEKAATSNSITIQVLAEKAPRFQIPNPFSRDKSPEVPSVYVRWKEKGKDWQWLEVRDAKLGEGSQLVPITSAPKEEDKFDILQKGALHEDVIVKANRMVVGREEDGAPVYAIPDGAMKDALQLASEGTPLVRDAVAVGAQKNLDATYRLVSSAADKHAQEQIREENIAKGSKSAAKTISGAFSTTVKTTAFGGVAFGLSKLAESVEGGLKRVLNFGAMAAGVVAILTAGSFMVKNFPDEEQIQNTLENLINGGARAADKFKRNMPQYDQNIAELGEASGKGLFNDDQFLEELTAEDRKTRAIDKAMTT